MSSPGLFHQGLFHQGLFQQIRRKTSHITFSNPIYDWSLGSGNTPPRLDVIPNDLWQGRAEAGKILCGGAFTLADEELAMTNSQCWEPVGVSEAWLVHMHGFGWLRDLKACGGPGARRQAREMVEHWIGRYARWHPLFWRADIVGRRLSHWIGLYNFYGQAAHDDFQEHLMAAMIRQARHLARALPGTLKGTGLLHGVKGLIYAALAFHGREIWLEQALDILEKETGRQILPDGGHVSRSPRELAEALQIFIDIRHALGAGEYPIPAGLEHSIDMMAQALRFFRGTDKGLALFNGAQEGDAALLDDILTRANVKRRMMQELPSMGYQRMTVGRSVLIADTGAPPPHPYDDTAHAAPLSLEFMYGKERILVNTGAHALDPVWQDVLRGTAAHNALSLDYRNAAEIRSDRHLGRKPRKVACRREDRRDGVVIDASHDGFVPLNGITHRRRLYLGDHGHDLRGEDTLTCPIGLSKPVDVVLRFHLHPRVQVSLIQEGVEALLRLQGGAGWRFYAGIGKLTLEDSIYLGQGSQPRKTKQLVVHYVMEGDSLVLKWALQREGL